MKAFFLNAMLPPQWNWKPIISPILIIQKSVFYSVDIYNIFTNTPAWYKYDECGRCFALGSISRGENEKKTMKMNSAEKTAAVQIGHIAINIITFLFVIFSFRRLLIRRRSFIVRNKLIYFITRLKSIPKVVKKKKKKN